MSWTDSDIAQPDEQSDRPKASILGDLRKGDEFSLTFESNGDEVTRDHGTQVAFDAVVHDIPSRVYTWSDEVVREGDSISFETSSSRLLLKLSNEMPLEGKTIKITVNGTGYDADYSIEEL